MYSRIRGYLNPPAVDTEVEQLQVSVLNALLLTMAVLTPVATVLLYILGRTTISSDPLTLSIGAAVTGIMLFLWWLLRRGYGEIIGWLALLVLFAGITLGMATFHGLLDTLIVGFALIVALSSFVLPDPRSTIIFVFLSLIALAAVYSLEATGAVTYAQNKLDVVDLFIPGLILILTGALITRSEQALRSAVRRAQASEMALEQSNQQLEMLNLALEARVAARTRALEISSDVSRRLSTILDRQELVTEVVDQLQQAFNYYHVHIYLLDESSERLVLAGGTGDAGTLMVQQGHALEIGRGLVGRAAASHVPVLVPDVTSEPAWVANPLLPQTKAELAVPITLGEELLGVLDVQHDVRGGLTDEDVELLSSIAYQVAVGLQNARLYETAQRQAEHEVVLNAITQRLQSTTTVEQALQVTVRELGRALQGQVVAVQLQSPGQQDSGSA